jgi:BirA family biotin operon repressor/biotin-[acetyl-CoA-carboxylase] ligase
LEIRYLNTVASTQLFLENAIKSGELSAPICVWTLDQTDGIGSRDNRWQGKQGNLAFSFAIDQKSLPNDLPIQSASLYFGFLFKETLRSYGSQVWLKWPNDFYASGKKIGGTITKRFDDTMICGIGLNIVSPDAAFGAIDIALEPALALEKFLNMTQSAPTWDEVFSGYRLEYPLSQAYSVGDFTLKNATLESDGSVRVGQERVFSQR